MHFKGIGSVFLVVITGYALWACKVRIVESNSLASLADYYYNAPYVCVESKSSVSESYRKYPRGDWVVIKLGKNLVGNIAGQLKLSDGKGEYFCGVRSSFVEVKGATGPDNIYFDIRSATNMALKFELGRQSKLTVTHTSGATKVFNHCQEWPEQYTEHTNPEFGFDCHSGE